MTRTCWTLLALLACGSREAPRRDPSPAAEAITDADLRAATATAQAFVTAFAAGDYPGMCATWSAEVRTALAEVHGTCEQALAVVAVGKRGDMSAGARAVNARRDGARIIVDFVHEHGTKPMASARLVEEGDRWLFTEPPGQPELRLPRATGPVEPLAESDPDVIAAKQTMAAYFEAAVMRDYAGMCETVSTKARQLMVDLVGSCEHGMEAYTRGQEVIVFAEMKLQNPRRRAGVLAFDLVHPSGAAYDPYFLTREGDRWLMVQLDRADRF